MQRLATDGKRARVRRAQYVFPFVLKNSYVGPFFGATGLTTFASCFVSFLACLVATARRFLVDCLLRLLFSIWE